MARESSLHRSARVKLQLRDKHGRWIEMGGGVKWFSSRFGKEIGGTVEGTSGSKALVRLSTGDPKKKGALVSVEAHQIEVVDSKAHLNLKAVHPDAAKPEAHTPVADVDTPAAPHVPDAVSDASGFDPNSEHSYQVVKTSDGAFYFARHDKGSIYTPAKELQVGDEIVAPDGTDLRKPYSIGAGWSRSNTERLSEKGKGIGTVTEIKPDRYAVVQLPEGIKSPDGKDTVTVGLSNDVIKATPGIKQALASAGHGDSKKSMGESHTMSGQSSTNNVKKTKIGDILVASDPENGNVEYKKVGENHWEASRNGEPIPNEQHLSDADVLADHRSLSPKDTSKPLTAPQEPQNPVEAPATAKADPNAPQAPQKAAEPVNEPAPVEAPAESYNENGLTAGEQKSADAYARLITKAEDAGDFQKADSYQAQLDELLKTGESRKGSDKKTEPTKTEPAAPAEPKAAEPKAEPTPAPAPPALVEPTKVENPITPGKNEGLGFQRGKNGLEQPVYTNSDKFTPDEKAQFDKLAAKYMYAQHTDRKGDEQVARNGLEALAKSVNDRLGKGSSNAPTVEPKKTENGDIVKPGTILTHNSGEQRIVTSSGKAGQYGNTTVPKDYVQNRKLRDGKPFGPTLTSKPEDFKELNKTDTTNAPAAPQIFESGPGKDASINPEDVRNGDRLFIGANGSSIANVAKGSNAHSNLKAESVQVTQVTGGGTMGTLAIHYRNDKGETGIATVDRFGKVFRDTPETRERMGMPARDTSKDSDPFAEKLRASHPGITDEHIAELKNIDAKIEGQKRAMRIERQKPLSKVDYRTIDKANANIGQLEQQRDSILNNYNSNKNEGSNGPETHTGGNSGTEDTGTSGEPSGTSEPNVRPTNGNDPGSGNNSQSGNTDPAGGAGTANEPSTGRSGQPDGSLTPEQLQAVSDGAILHDSSGDVWHKSGGEFYNVKDFLNTGDKTLFPADSFSTDDGMKEITSGRKFTDAELEPAIDYFVRNSFTNVNDYVRNGQEPAGTQAGYSDLTVSVLDDAIAHSPLARDSSFYRGMQLSGEDASKLSVGSIINDKGFTSITPVKSIADAFATNAAEHLGITAPENPASVFIKLDLPKGHNVLPVNYEFGDTAGHAGQKEHILGRDSNLKITSITSSKKDGKDYYTVSAVPATQDDLNALPKPDPKAGNDAEGSNLPSDIPRNTPEALPGEKFPPTQQQQDVIDAVLAGKDTLVQAKAGAGKTTTLEAIARRLQAYKPGNDKVIYIAFNTTVAAEAKKRMPSNVESRTGHSLSYRWSPDWMKDRMSGKASRTSLRNGNDIADHIGIKEDIKSPSLEDPLEPYDQAMMAMKAVDTYAYSAEDHIGAEHFPEATFESLSPEDQAKMIGYANAIWSDLSSETGKIKFSQDTARKHWALSRPDFTKGEGGWQAANTLFIDEAQDTPPVLAKVVADQKMQKVIVGDADQAIYGFTGATDFLSQAKGDIELPLNKSWRFGPEVADVGNRFLQMLNSKGRVVGGGPSSQIVNGLQNPDAILVRSNAGMVSEILKELGKGRSVGVPAKTKKDLVNLFNHADQLKNGFKGKAFHEDLAQYKTWKEFVKAAEGEEDPKATMIHNLIETYGIPELQKMIARVQDPEDAKGSESGAHPLSSPVGQLWQKIKVDHIGDDIVLSNTWAFNAKLKETIAERGLSELGFRYNGNDKKWYAKGNTPAQKADALKRLEDLMAEQDGANNPPPAVGKADVIISTAHKAKGLEWGSVRIGDDFKGPQKSKTTGQIIMPNDDELRLAYVAVTRAEKQLDPGSLGYVFAHSNENGVNEPNLPSDPIKHEPVNVPEPVNTPEPVSAPEPVSKPEPVNVPEPVSKPEPVAAPAPVNTPEPAPVPAPAPTPAPVEKPTANVVEHNENGYTPSEQARVNFLENKVANIYKGKEDGNVEPLEEELNTLYTIGENRLNGIDTPEHVIPAEPKAEPAPTPAPKPVSAPTPAPAPTPEPKVTPAPVEPTTPTKRAWTKSNTPVVSSNGVELKEGSVVNHPKYSGTVVKVIGSTGSVRIRREDGKESVALGKKLTAVDPSAPKAAPTPAPVDHAIGHAGIDPSNGKAFFIGSDGKRYEAGDRVSHPTKGDGTVKSIYVGATSVAVIWDNKDTKGDRAQTKILSGVKGSEPHEPVSTPKVDPTPAPVEPTAPAEPKVEPVSVEKKSLKVAGPIEGGDPIGTSGPVSPHGELVNSNDGLDNYVLSIMYPSNSVVTYTNKKGDVMFRMSKGSDGMWYEIDEHGNDVNSEQFHQFIPHLKNMKMFVKIDPNGKRDDRNQIAPNEKYLDSLKVGTKVDTRDGVTFTKEAQGLWRSSNGDASLNWGVNNYGITEVHDGSGYTHPDYKTEGWAVEPYKADGTHRDMTFFRLRDGSTVAFASQPNIQYTKEDGVWKESLNGVRTGMYWNSLRMISKRSPGDAYVLSAAPEAAIKSLRSGPKIDTPYKDELNKVFTTDIRDYSGIDKLFSTYDSSKSNFNALTSPLGGREEVTNSNGDVFRTGARVYDKNGDYVGMVSALVGDGRMYLNWGSDSTLIKDSPSRWTSRDINDYTTKRTKDWNTSTNLDFSNAKSTSEVTKKLNETYAGTSFNFAPRLTDLRTAKAMGETYSKILNKYPMLKEALATVSSEKFTGGRLSSANAAAQGFGVIGGHKDEYMGAIKFPGINVGFNVGRSHDQFVRGKRESQGTRWNNHIEAGKEVEATVTHEMGHTLDFLTGRISEERVLELISQLLGEDITRNSPELGRMLFDNHMLSGYSLKFDNVNPVELVAESFQDVEMNGADAKPLSKLVHQELMQRLATLGAPSVESATTDNVSAPVAAEGAPV